MKDLEVRDAISIPTAPTKNLDDSGVLEALNFTPELLDKTQEEAKLQNTSFDALVRIAVEKYLRASDDSEASVA